MKIKKEAVLGNSTDLGFIYESLSIRKFVVQLSDVQSLNEPSPIDVTPLGIITTVVSYGIIPLVIIVVPSGTVKILSAILILPFSI